MAAFQSLSLALSRCPAVVGVILVSWGDDLNDASQPAEMVILHAVLDGVKPQQRWAFKATDHPSHGIMFKCCPLIGWRP